MPIALPRVAEEVGIVLSGASASMAPIALRRDRELRVLEEDLVLLVDPRLENYYMLGVVRWITRYEPFLRRNIHNIYVEHPDALDTEVVMPFSNAYVEIYAGICDGSPVCDGARGLVNNVYAPTPGSKVFKLVDAKPLTDYLTVSRPITIGVHRYSKWRLPLDTEWLNYHVGVFGATGTGKSRLILRMMKELVEKGYSLIVFDHSGVDYAPFVSRLGGTVVRASEIRIEPQILASIISRLTGVQSQQRDAVEIAAMCYAMSVYSSNGGGERYKSEECNEILGHRTRQQGLARYTGEKQPSARDEFLELLKTVATRLNMRPASILKLRLLTRLSVPEHVFEGLKARRLEPLDVVDTALRERLVVVDMSDEQDIEVKRGILASIANAAWEKIGRERSPLGLGLVVDEAQNYACEYCGEAGRALETIAREGRKWKYFIIVASQRIARDIRPGVRSNLGTVFFSKLQSTGDLQELAGYLDLGRVTEASLAMLGRREFYVAGLMNPLRRPLLMYIDSVDGG
ncbi:ATP-binding protein [Pyrodictium abyssi]|uniref:ATP-binding protein n=1 Tax=Pyrodictium abyssi TaxID=54256 RepID=A0ABM8IZY0_9CREN|nr:ATP-binding protein [Pyrodictium abyssi]